MAMHKPPDHRQTPQIGNGPPLFKRMDGWMLPNGLSPLIIKIWGRGNIKIRVRADFLC